MSDTMSNTAYAPGPMARGRSFFTEAEAWLDARGKPAWIAATVLGFIAFWPIGLALLFYMLFFRQRAAGGCSPRSRANFRRGVQSSGNNAFDSYRDETLRRLEDEQKSFERFLERLREAKDKAEFDQFMEDRAERAANATVEHDEPRSRPDEPRPAS